MKRVRAWLKPGVKEWFVFWLPVAMLVFTPLMSAFLANRPNATIYNFIPPTLANLLTASIIATIFYRLRRHRLAAFIGAILSALLLGFNYDDRLSNIMSVFTALSPFSLGSYQDAFASAVFMVLIVVGAYWSGRLISGWLSRYQNLSREAIPAITIATAVIFLTQFVPAAKYLATALPQYFYRPPALHWKASVTNNNRPDIYYIVMEDMAGPSQMKSQLGYDESGFLSSLEAKDYYVPQNVYANYPSSTMSVASTLNAGYLSDVIDKFASSAAQTLWPYHLSIRFGAVIPQLKQLGYKYVVIGNWYETTTKAPLADKFYQPFSNLTIMGKVTILEQFALDRIDQSPYWRFIEAGLKIGPFQALGYSDADSSDLPLQQLQDLKTIAGQPAGGRLIFAHLMIPHGPYYFNADGSLNMTSGEDNTGASLTTKYVNQVKFASSQINSILATINKNSGGKAVVVLQSDEGPKLADQGFDSAATSSDPGDSDDIVDDNMTNWSQKDLDLKYGITAAYHIPGASAEGLAAGADPINVFRLIFNTDFGTNLPYLAQCYYGFSKDSDHGMVYGNINKQLTGTTNASCAANGDGPK